MMEKESLVITKLVVGTFETQLGKKLLLHLNDTLVRRPMYKKGMTLDEVAFRQGQADVIAQLNKEMSNG